MVVLSILCSEDPDPVYDGGVESGFEGAFDNYATNAQDSRKDLMAMASNAGQGVIFEGVEPMGMILLYIYVLCMSFVGTLAG